MPTFHLQQIRKLAGDQKVYLRGTDCYAGGGVTAFARSSDGGYGERVTASVHNRGSQPPSHPSATVDATGQVIAVTCDCRSHQRTGAVCKHIVALLTYKYYADMVAGLQENGSLRTTAQPAPDRTVSQMVESYVRQEQAVAALDVSPTKLRLMPVLELTATAASLGLMLGDERLYVVKDLGQFVQRMSDHAIEAYGQQLTVVHHPDAFAPEDQALLRFICGLSISGGRQHPLSPAEFTTFLTLMRDRPIMVRRDDAEQVLVVKHENPHLSLTVAGEGDGVVLSTPAFSLWNGQGCAVILTENGLYQTDAAFAAAAGPLLAALYSKRFNISLDPPSATDFCAAVWPAIAPYISLEGDGEALLSLAPHTPSFEILLDAPSADRLTARINANYAEQPARRHRPAEMRVEALLTRFMDRNGDEWVLPATEDERLFAFLQDGVPAFGQVASLLISDAFRRIRFQPETLPAISLRLHTDWLELDTDIPMSQEEWQGILSSVRRRKRYHRLKNGQFLSLDESGLPVLATLLEQWGNRRDGKVALPLYSAVYVKECLEAGGLSVDVDAGADALIDRLQHAYCQPHPVPHGLQDVLRPYQQEGYRWMCTLQACGMGGILADDMGLGKTVQMIAVLADAREREGRAPTLITCPASLVYNWRRELRRFAPALSVLTVSGTAEQRRDQIKTAENYDVVITSYDLLRRDEALYADTAFRYHVLDEAQYIKNEATKNARAVKSIRSDRRFALTGTPIENRLGELWSIFDFLMPGFLSTYRRFRDRYERPITQEQDVSAANRLRHMCAPFILRRLKSDVLTELPPKIEKIRCVAMTEPQRKLYEANLAEARASAATMRSGADRIRVLALLTRLRQICCDPSLCYEDYTGGSGKTEDCLYLIRQAMQGGHKVLVFSQFASMLEQLEKQLQADGIAYELLRGSTPVNERSSMVDRFNASDIPVFLISLKAGGTGLNLTGADVVIHFDPWWNRSAQNQATDRAHRIGQERPVQIYKLICDASIEQKILQLQDEKQRLSDAVIPEGDFFAADAAQIREWLS